jgi:sequestosome 1
VSHFNFTNIQQRSSFPKFKMEDNTVAYKVTLNETSSVDSEVRRFVIDRDVSTSLTYLREKLSSVFPAIRRKDFKLTWHDEDGDKVTIRSDDELVIALTEMKGPIYKLTVDILSTDKTDYSRNDGESSRNSDGEEHTGVMCDGCEKPVIGFRYKCVMCPDYDLCGRCETKGLHPDHNMIRISSPQSAWPHHFYRRLHRMHDKAQKRCGPCPGRGEQQPRPPCGPKGNSFGMPGCHSGPTEGFPFRPHGGSPFRHPGGFPFRPPGFGPCGNKWVDAMMKGWAGANEEHQAAKEAAPNSSNQSAQSSAPEHSAAGGASNHTKEEDAKHKSQGPTSFDELLANSLGSPNGNDFLRNVGQIVASMLDPLGVDVKIDIESPHGEIFNVNKGCCKKSDETTAKSEQDKTDEKSADSSATPSDVERKDEDDEWTVVTKSSEARHEPEAKDDAAALYPQLPSSEESSQTLNHETEKKEEVQVEAEKRKESAVASHPDPRIQVALQAMMNMGFTNDGGWLTQLLETKQGDIGKVLDVLQPVHPNRR